MRIGPRTYGAASCQVNFCTVLPNRRHDLREVTHVWCDPAKRGQGQASEMMQKLCTEADTKLMVLLLSAKPYGDEKGPDVEGLQKFYAKFGFQSLPGDEGAMARPPYPDRFKQIEGAPQ
jgi:N-acetylglutamate synthase-like GNAT family acetyltransferase